MVIISQSSFSFQRKVFTGFQIPIDKLFLKDQIESMLEKTAGVEESNIESHVHE